MSVCSSAENAMMNRSLLAPVMVTFWLSSGSVGVGASDAQPLAEKDAQLVLRLPDFNDSTPEFKLLKGNRSVYEIGSWVATGNVRAMASLTYIRFTQPNLYTYTEDSVLPLPEKVRNTFERDDQARIQLGNAGRSSNHIGELEYQEFSYESKFQCVFMRQFFGGGQHVDLVVGSVNEPLGDRLLRGWYCEAARGSPLSGHTRAQFFDGVGIRDWSMPRSQRQASANDALMIGLLPPAFFSPTSPSSTQKEELIYAEVRRLVRSEPGLALSFDYATKHGVRPPDPHGVWRGSMVTKIPDISRLQAIAEETGVDLLVLAWIKSMWARTEIDLYVFDVASGQLHESSGDLDRARHLVDSAFDFSITRTRSAGTQ